MEESLALGKFCWAEKLYWLSNLYNSISRCEFFDFRHAVVIIL